MKSKYLIYAVLIFVEIAVALSCLYFPVSRDGFYYIGREYPDPISEYIYSYFYANPRINQFICNLISRTQWLQVLFGMVLFNSFFLVIYLNIYRKLPKFSDKNDVLKLLVVSAFFIFSINYFGEFFYYTSYSTNYTFAVVFYLFYIFLFTSYFQEKKSLAVSKLPVLFFIIFGVYVGMCNEHVPPVLLLVACAASVHFLLKNKKLPHFKIIILNLSVLTGYLLLFFAPANKIKQTDVKKSLFDLSLGEYLHNLANAIKYYYYYNTELIIVSAAILLIIAFDFKKVRSDRNLIQKTSIYLLFAVLTLFVVGISPLVGTRLLFFSTTLYIIVLYQLANKLYISNMARKIYAGASLVWLILFFSLSIYITYRAFQNNIFVFNEIKEKSKTSREVVLDKGLQYFSKELGIFNYKVLLEDGSAWIDRNPEKNNSQENILLHHFNIKKISHK